jgi:hypothetical protein
MRVRGLSFRFSLLNLAVLAAVVRTSQAACEDTASDCTSCSSCTEITYSSGALAHVWISDIDDGSNPGSGTCTDIYNPQNPISSNYRRRDLPPFCGKRVFASCSGGSISSQVQSCSSTPPSPPSPGPSPPSPSPPSGTTCVSNPAYCSSCSSCLSIGRESDELKSYYWVNSDDSTTAGSGTCVQRYDPIGSSSPRSVDSTDLCGKRVFLECTNGLTSSVKKSCPFVSGVSQLKLSPSLAAIVVSLLALFVVAM